MWSRHFPCEISHTRDTPKLTELLTPPSPDWRINPTKRRRTAAAVTDRVTEFLHDKSTNNKQNYKSIIYLFINYFFYLLMRVSVCVCVVLVTLDRRDASAADRFARGRGPLELVPPRAKRGSHCVQSKGGIRDHHRGVVVRVKSVVVKSEMTAGAVCRCRCRCRCSSAALMVLQQRVGTYWKRWWVCWRKY